MMRLESDSSSFYYSSSESSCDSEDLFELSSEDEEADEAQQQTEQDVEMDDNNDDSDVEMVDAAAAENGASFQRTVWQHRLLPYFDELTEEADRYFAHIKAGLAYSVLMRDARPGLIYWVHELDRFIQLNSFRFTKVDHVNILKLLYKALTMRNLDFRVVKVVCGTICTLLSRKSLLSRKDLQFEWRPLYELYVDVAYKNLEEDGLMLLPDNLKKALNSTILECNHFFTDEATQEILDEVRPYFCPWDDSFIRGASVVAVFLPTALEHEEHDKFGASLWVEELLGWLTNPVSNDKVQEKFLYTLARLAKDSPGYYDFSPYFQHLFTLLLASLKLELGVDKVISPRAGSSFGSLTQIIAYSFGMADNKIQNYLGQLFLTLESYFHPSNTGVHTTTMLNFLLKLCAAFLYRCSRERYHANRYRKTILTQMRISDAQVDAFVKSVLPCLEYAAFSKVKEELVPSIIRVLSFLAPGIIIPFVLDLVYPSLQTLTEPHRLTQSLHILACICVALVRDNPSRSGGGERLPIKSVEDMEAHLKSYRKHAIVIMNNILPGLDVNDIAKSALAFQIVTILLLLIPIVDSSQSPLQLTDLSEEEAELCSATASFDSFIDQLMGRIFSMIELLGSGASERHALATTKLAAKNMEEFVIERGVMTVFKVLIRNCNSAFYQYITDRFYEFIRGFVYNSKPAMDTITKMASSIVSNDPANQFPRFFKYAVEQFNRHFHEGCEDDEEVDHALIWYTSFACDVLYGAPGHVLLANRAELDAFLARIRRFKSPGIFKLAATFAHNLLHTLCSVYSFPKCYMPVYDQPPDKYLPIRHWAETVNKDTWTLEWHVPSEAEVDYAAELVEQLVTTPLQQLLANESGTSDKEMLRVLTIARFAFEGSSNLCPFFDGPVLSLIPMSTPNVVFDTTTVPKHVKRITAADGTNYRCSLFTVVSGLAELFLKERENDTKSSLELLSILRVLLHVRGIDMSSFSAQSSTFQMTKRILADPLRGYRETIETVMESTLAMMHTKRILHRPLVGVTATHLDALLLILRFGTSLYSTVRYSAQKLLDSSFIWWSFSYKLVLDRVLVMLKEPSQHTYEQFKGALYVLVNGKEMSILVRQDWESLTKIWPVLCTTQSPEAGKQSVISLLDMARDIVVNNFSSFQIEFQFPVAIFPLATALLADYDGNVHKNPMLLPVELLQTAGQREVDMNESNRTKYIALAESLYEIGTSRELHWRHVDFAQALLSLLLRRDARLPDQIVLHFFQLLNSDSIKARKMAIGFCGTWLKINRQKACKVVVPTVEQGQNLGPGAKWPIEYGLRRDNRFVLFEQDKQPRTAQEWDTARFLHKPHWGFYTWPAEFRCYAGPADQTWANRDFGQFTPVEQAIVETFSSPEFRSKLVALYSLEEKKGSEEFDPVNYALFYRLFRSFNDTLLDPFFELLDPLLKDQRESHQRLAAEIVAGLICGAKLWRFEKQQRLVDWLRPRLMQTLLDITQEAEKNWGTCMATIFGVCEPMQAGWLIDMLFQLIQKPTEISSHVKTRLYLLHCALNQSEWRVPAQWRQLAEHCLQMTDYLFQNVRLRLGSCLATTTFCDFEGIHVEPEMGELFKLVTVGELVGRINEQLKPLWDETLVSDRQAMQHVDSSSSLGELMAIAGEEHKPEKLRLITLINFLYSLTAQFTSCMDTSTIHLAPLFAHYANDNTDEELKGNCGSQLIRTMGLSQIRVDQIDTFFATCAQIQEKAVWWKAKITLLRFLQVFAFSNLFILRDYNDSLAQLRQLILKLLVDARFEVRVASAETLSGLVRAGIVHVDADLLESAEQLANSLEPIPRHSGVLALAAIILAFPYSVPAFLPDVLMKLCKHASERQPIFGTVKRALSDFKRTHQDEWHEHKLEFTEDQLQILTGLIISPNYYV